MKRLPCLLGLLLAGVASAPVAKASDWPQFMRDGAHTGDAADEELRLPLGLVAQVKLDDAVMTSPVVVGGLAFVVDQMGTAYCIDPRVGRIIWRASPDGEKAMGSNTSSPCVAKGRVYYGTTAGTFHILDAKDGKVVKTVNIGWPIVSAVVLANDSIYFQALDAVVRCLDLDGNEKWKWDHYVRYKEPPETTAKEENFRNLIGGGGRVGRAMDGRPHYGGRDVSVSGTKVVTAIGWDLVCLEDKGGDAALAWCRRAPNGPVPISSSISGERIYTAGIGGDGYLGLMRFALKDGEQTKDTREANRPDPWLTPAVRGSAATTRWDGRIVLFDHESGKALARMDQEGVPAISSQALTKGHCVATTLSGELVVLAFDAQPGTKPLRIATPHGKPIGSSPAVSGGCVHFGCDDGYFYVYGPGGALQPRKDDKLTVHEPRSKVVPATGKAYGWTSTRGNQANTYFADDPNFKPPLRLRWAIRTFGHFKTSGVATAEGDYINVTNERTVTCLEQATGRMRWRLRLPPGSLELFSSAGLLVEDGRVYVPCPEGVGSFRMPQMLGKLLCLDVKDGRTLWSADIGVKFMWWDGSPLLAGGKVIFGHLKKATPPVAVVEAWEADTGKPAWQVEMSITTGDTLGGAGGGSMGDGCVAGDKLYYTAGAGGWGWKSEGDRKRGETLAIDAKTGNVLWRNTENFATRYPALAGDRLFMWDESSGPLKCISTADGKLLWKAGNSATMRQTVGPDFIAARTLGGNPVVRFRLEDGKELSALPKALGSDTHACGHVLLTPNLCIAVAVGGLSVQDVKTGARLWASPGFAPVGCQGPLLSNGRVFWTSSGSGMAFCWEPEK